MGYADGETRIASDAVKLSLGGRARGARAILVERMEVTQYCITVSSRRYTGSGAMILVY